MTVELRNDGNEKAVNLKARNGVQDLDSASAEDSTLLLLKLGLDEWIQVIHLDIRIMAFTSLSPLFWEMSLFEIYVKYCTYEKKMKTEWLITFLL